MPRNECLFYCFVTATGSEFAKSSNCTGALYHHKLYVPMI